MQVPDPLNEYLRDSISNGNVREQANIRKWWVEAAHSSGLLAWEYPLDGYHVDAIWFPKHEISGETSKGRGARTSYPISGHQIVICEAKSSLSPTLVGQAVVYKALATKAGAKVIQVNLFVEKASEKMIQLVADLGFHCVLIGKQAT